MNVHTCQRCGTKFERRQNGNEYKYCSHTCNATRVRFNPEILEMFAASGMKVGDISRRLGLRDTSASYIRRCLKRYGWYAMWQQARYKKCRESV